MTEPRKYTVKILEYVGQGVLDPQMVMEACLAYMSEYDVEDMFLSNDGFGLEEEEEFGPEDEE